MRRGPRVHFSFRSPFSWMALDVLYRRFPNADELLEFIPYWEPDERTASALANRGAAFHYVQMSKAKHLYILHDTRRQAVRLGLRMAWPIDDDPWWELPHLGWLRARRLGMARPFYRALTAARWERGENICEPGVVRAACEEVGCDAEAMLAAPHSAEIREEGVDCLETAYQDDIFGIPYFRVGRHRFWGLDRLDDFLAELAELSAFSARSAHPNAVMPAPPEPVAARVGNYDTDTAGGCG